MAYQNENQKQAPEQEEKPQPEERSVQEQAGFALPNSLMAAMPEPPPPPGTPNSVMCQMLFGQIPEAEKEADHLSAGITSGTPNSVRREMGERLGSDFSSVNFHSNSQSVRMNESMGSRAYTRGSDVYFGRGGFNASVAAHELVHTVQQRAIPGRVGQFVPFGTVQMLEMPKWMHELCEHFHIYPKVKTDDKEKFKKGMQIEQTKIKSDNAAKLKAHANHTVSKPAGPVKRSFFVQMKVKKNYPSNYLRLFLNAYDT